MDATEPQEPSYYEVALTNRQVLVAFVALLSCLLVAFLAGVWIGRGGAETESAKAPHTAPEKVAEPPLEQLSFFNGAEGASGSKSAAPAAPSKVEPTPAVKPQAAPAAATDPTAAVPAPAGPAAPAGDASETMRQNLEATMAANRDTPAMKMAVGERTGEAPAPAATAPPAAKPATATPAAKPAAAVGKMFVQVYSSGNGARAREIVASLRKAGFPVVIAETQKTTGKNFRVRVGPFEDRAKADAAAIRLRRDHRLDTWVTDSP